MALGQPRQHQAPAPPVLWPAVQEQQRRPLAGLRHVDGQRPVLGTHLDEPVRHAIDLRHALEHQ